MRGRLNLMWVGIWALGTIGVCALIWPPVQSRAQEGIEPEVPVRPVFAHDGLQMEIVIAPDTPLKVSDKPRLVLTASNPTADDVTTRVRVQLTSQLPASQWSRVISLPEPFYTTDVQITVKAGRKAALTIDSDQPAPVGVIAARLSPVPEADTTPATDAPNTLALLSAGVVFPLGSTVVDATAVTAQAGE